MSTSDFYPFCRSSCKVAWLKMNKTEVPILQDDVQIGCVQQHNFIASLKMKSVFSCISK